ncbi:hypothetical protein LV84_02377 [Algoriphagus ratkowskyi]|uniref:Uncharacterized protein n=1 Tax=Algoriphagus ratkowskyi TaxID=57028 RepID=A0A2W7R563_9BACT|nr:hypothetical protein LV84_02377 [Algoriphagus ratkowskyi]
MSLGFSPFKLDLANLGQLNPKTAKHFFVVISKTVTLKYHPPAASNLSDKGKVHLNIHCTFWFYQIKNQC